MNTLSNPDKSNPDKAAIELRQLTVSYGNLPALFRVSATIPEEKITAIIGPNGSGKTTLLKAILGLMPLQEGSVSIMGAPFEKVRDHLAYVPQKDEVDWNYPLLVKEVVAMGRYRLGNILRRLERKDYRIIEASLEKLNLRHIAHRPIGHLSGGEKQRMFLARALAREADIFLLDEPFNGVDATTEKVILRYLEELKESGKTVVMVHHRLEDVTNFDWSLLLNQKLIDYGPINEVFNQARISRTYGTAGIGGIDQGEDEPCLIF